MVEPTEIDRQSLSLLPHDRLGRNAPRPKTCAARQSRELPNKATLMERILTFATLLPRLPYANVRADALGLSLARCPRNRAGLVAMKQLPGVMNALMPTRSGVP